MKYITIEREYGSGGTKIARELAARCSLPCYGEEILERAAEKLHMPVNAIREYEEKATNSMLYSLYVFSQANTGNAEMLSTEGKVFVEEQNVIREFARESSAIFLGHCASAALQEYEDVIKVYIYADEKTKRERIQEDYGISETEISLAEKRNNRRRAKYYQANTQKKWEDFRNYDIVLNSSTLGIERCVKILEGIFK